ncbi:MAG TPA: 3-phosphoshikimate 1-carboxyvinyltransferase [Pyrinomonadaceae bacterium]|nr:3-phosphoshikimate 1-carboxyvinyltransferase [Pyrinomonadaceae bacterium]
MRIIPARRMRGSLRLPGDKSISHRAAILSALARGQARINNFSTSRDCARTLACLNQLGVEMKREGTTVTIEGVGLGGLRAAADSLDCGNSGSTIRMLAGVLSGQDFVSALTGDASLRSRPMKRIIEPLELMGARILSEDGRAPLKITGCPVLKGIHYEMPVASAQLKSAILLAGLNAEGHTRVIEEQGATRDHTERMLRSFGVPISSMTMEDRGITKEALTIEDCAQFEAQDGTIPGDISSAAFFIAAAALLPGSKLNIYGVGLNPTRTRLLSVLRSLGVDVKAEQAHRGGRMPEDFNEPYGKISVMGGAGLAPLQPGRSNVLSGALVSQVIDELPVLAVLGSQVMGGISIREAKELRVKESDRISATVSNLRAMGAEVEEHEDGLTINEHTRLRGAKINAYGDHRIAMAFAIAALIAEGESEIAGAECVGVSFPEFFELLESVVER